MQKNKTFQNLLVLEQARDTTKELLKEKYYSVVNPIRTIIEMVMKNNNENHFEAVKRIQDETTLMINPEKKILFSAALMEIVEEVNLKPNLR